MSEHVMVDIETLGRTEKAVILSIGATKFNPNDLGEVISKFYVTVSPQSCVDIGMTMDVSTIMWWMHPDRSVARDQLITEAGSRLDIHSALEGFAIWYGPNSLPTWGNGATFDNVILKNTYALARMELPWTFRDDRCFRTLKNLVPKQEEFFFGTHHNALDDAMYQTQMLQRIVAALGIKL